jgi:thiol-disulfide isomerase/thioredoxin
LKTKIFPVLLLQLCLQVQSNAQALKAGDKMPDIHFGEILNYPKKTAKLSDFKGKLLILDFWNTHCPPCIAAMPKVDSLQKQFGDKIFILPMGFEIKKGEIKQFIEKRKGTSRAISSPTTVESIEYFEKTFMKLFPTAEFPCEIWIDSSGSLLGTDNVQSLTPNNIQRYFEGKPLLLKTKDRPGIITEQDWFLVKQGIYSSAFRGYMDTLISYSPDGKMFGRDSATWHFTGINLPVFQFYKMAFAPDLPQLSGDGGSKRIIVEPSGKPFYKDPTGMEFMDNLTTETFSKENLFCYELALSSAHFTKDDAFAFMKQDLDRIFKVRSSVEDRKIKCLTLVRIAADDHLSSKKKSTGIVTSENGDSIYLNNMPFKTVLNFLEIKTLTPLPITDETKFLGSVDIHVAADNVSVEKMRMVLNRYGLDLVETEMTMPVLILKDLR